MAPAFGALLVEKAPSAVPTLFFEISMEVVQNYTTTTARISNG
jgi:hypothetical protein